MKRKEVQVSKMHMLRWNLRAAAIEYKNQGVLFDMVDHLHRWPKKASIWWTEGLQLEGKGGDEQIHRMR